MSGAEDAYDVAIIGYGPVGVTAANLLGQLGLSVLVAERDADVYSRARAISTDEEILRIWQRIGLAERLKQDMLSERPIDFVDDRGRSFLSFAPRGFGNGHPPQLFIYQPALEKVLREGVDRFPNVEVRLRHEVVRFRQDADGVYLTLLGLDDDVVRRARARYVIAADGGSSPTRGQLGVSFEGRTFEDRWVVIDTEVRQEWPTHDRLRFHCDPERPAVDCPTPLGHHRWEFPVLAGDDESELTTEATIWRLLERQGIGPEHVRILRAVVYSHHVRFAATWRVGRIFLAGDAAHVMPPWIGQGMASGVRDVNNLCWKLAGVLAGELPESVLDSYETERQPHVRAVTQRAVFFGKVITERRPAVTRVRNVAFRTAMRVPGVGPFLREAKWMPMTRYVRGFLVADRRGAVGRAVPQPWVLDEHGERARLDDALGAGWRVLTLGSDQAVRDWSAAGVPIVQVLPAGSTPTAGAVVDTDGVLRAWLQTHCAATVALRPDGVVHSAAPAGARLPAPPLRAQPGPAQPAHTRSLHAALPATPPLGGRQS